MARPVRSPSPQEELNRGRETRNEEDDEETELEEEEPREKGSREKGHPQGQRVVGAGPYRS